MIKKIQVKNNKPFKFTIKKEDLFFTITSSGLLKVTKERNHRKIEVSFVKRYDKLVTSALKNDIFTIEQLEGMRSLSVYLG